MARRPPESRELKTTQEVLAALGGLRVVAVLCGIRDIRNVDNWQRQPTFPARYFLVMTFALHHKGLSAPPSLWGQVTPAQRRQAVAAMIAAVKEKAA